MIAADLRGVALERRIVRIFTPGSAFRSCFFQVHVDYLVGQISKQRVGVRDSIR